MEFAIVLVNFTIIILWFMYMYMNVKSLVWILTGKAFDHILNLEWEIRIAFGLVLVGGFGWTIGSIGLGSWIVWIILFVWGLRSLKKHKT